MLCWCTIKVVRMYVIDCIGCHLQGLENLDVLKVLSFEPGKVMDENVFHWKNCLVAGKFLEMN